MREVVARTHTAAARSKREACKWDRAGHLEGKWDEVAGGITREQG